MARMREIGASFDKGYRDDLNYNFGLLEALIGEANGLTDNLREEMLGKINNLQQQIDMLTGENIGELLERLNDSIQQALTAAQEARTAKTATEEATALAKAATELANASALLAEEKANYANEKAVLAQEAADNANQEASNLSQLKIDVVKATQDANAATGNANQATQAAQTATDAINVVLPNVTGLVNLIEWNNETQYKKNNFVTLEGNGYMALRDNKGVKPPSSPVLSNADWAMIVQKGEKGEQGTGVRILGTLPDENSLPPIGELGDAYMVGEQGNLYVWQANEEIWQNAGPIKGPKGDTGPQGPDGPQGPPGKDADLTEVNQEIANLQQTVTDNQQVVTEHLGQYNQQMPKKMDKGAWYVDVKDFGATGDGFTDDIKAINDAINSLPVGSYGGGTVIIPEGNYRISKPILLKNGVTLLGVSPQATRIFAKSNDFTLLKADNASRVEVKNLMLDGASFTGVYGITVSNSIGCKVENVWIDSTIRGVHTVNSYYLYFESVRVMGTSIGYNFENVSNVINMKNCYSVTTQKAMNLLGSSTLNVAGCSFEGKGLVSLKNVQGASFTACYWEGLHEEDDIFTFVEVGGLAGDIAKGINFSGNFFLVKAQYGISLQSCEGVSIDGNFFGTSLGGVIVYQADNAPKRDINIGSNSYDIGNLGHDITKAIAYLGEDFNSLNCNLNTTQMQPMMFTKQKVPQDVSIEKGAAVIYWDGQNLKLKVKSIEGVVSIKTFTLS